MVGLGTSESSSAVVIGGGAAGLAVGATLRRRGIEPLIVERSASVGGLWDAGSPGAASRSDVRLVSSAGRLGFDGGPVDSSHPYPLQGEVLAYLRRYAEEHLDSEYLRLGDEAVDFSPGRAGGWRIRLRSGEVLRAEAVVICTGLYRAPFVPAQRMKTKTGSWVHSRDFTPRLVRRGDRVRVVGAGNSSADVALSAHRAGAEVWLQWQSVPWLLPSFIGDRPADTVDFDFDRVPRALRGHAAQLRLTERAEGTRERLATALGGAVPDGLPYEAATITGDRLADLLLASPDGVHVSPHQGPAPPCDLTVYCTGYAKPGGRTGLARRGIDRDPLGIAATSLPGLYFVGNVKTEGGGFGVFSRTAEVVAALISHRRRHRSHQRLLAALDSWRPDFLWGLRRAPGSDLVYSEALFHALGRMRGMAGDGS
jgi:Flavin-binding monooxygenase-like